MSDSGVGMILGHTSVVLFYMIGVGIIVLGIALELEADAMKHHAARVAIDHHRRGGN